MDLPSSAHFIYIPGVLILGLVLGFVWGSRATQESYRLEAKRVEEVAAKKAARAQQREVDRAAQAAAGAKSDEGASETARKG